MRLVLFFLLFQVIPLHALHLDTIPNRRANIIINGEEWSFLDFDGKSFPRYDDIYKKVDGKWHLVAHSYFQPKPSQRDCYNYCNFISRRKKAFRTVGNYIFIHGETRYLEIIGANSNTVLFDTRTLQYKEIETFHQTYIVGFQEYGKDWLAYGYDTAKTGKLFYTKDTVNWEKIYAWKNEEITNVFVKSVDSIFIKSRNGSVLLLKREFENFVAEPLITYHTNDDSTIFPGEFYPWEFYFENDTLGYIGEHDGHSGYEFKTTDGGRTWFWTNKPRTTISRISDIQQALKKRGYRVEINGILDVESRKALIEFQRNHGLPEGRLDIETLKKLGVWEIWNKKNSE